MLPSDAKSHELAPPAATAGPPHARTSAGPFVPRHDDQGYTDVMRKINTRDFRLATRSTPREINRQIVLNLVREHQPISRADLALRMRVGRGMVTSIVAELLSDGSIYEGTTVEAPRGRKPMMLHVRTHDRLVVAVDVRFSKTKVMLADFNGTPIALETFDTVVEPKALVAALAKHIARLLKTHRAVGKCNG